MLNIGKVLLTMVLLMCAGNASAKNILVLGDSISAGYGITAEQGWVSLLQQKLKVDHQSFQVINDSISGDTSAGGLARIARLLTQYKPHIVILELGANDGLRGLSPITMQANLTEIIKKIQQTGSKVLLLGIRIPPNYGKRYTEMFYGVYATLAKDLNIAWVPFILEEVALKGNLMQADGLHPNAQAQPIILETIWPKLLTLL